MAANLVCMGTIGGIFEMTVAQKVTQWSSKIGRLDKDCLNINFETVAVFSSASKPLLRFALKLRDMCVLASDFSSKMNEADETPSQNRRTGSRGFFRMSHIPC